MIGVTFQAQSEQLTYAAVSAAQHKVLEKVIHGALAMIDVRLLRIDVHPGALTAQRGTVATIDVNVGSIRVRIAVNEMFS